MYVIPEIVDTSKLYACGTISKAKYVSPDLRLRKLKNAAQKKDAENLKL